MITCHLGSGSSLAAIKNGASIMTTMGYTPLDGLIMKSRSGTIDPGVLIHLLQEEVYSVDGLNSVLNLESGLKGIAGLSGDMREILALAPTGNHRAQLALDMYINSVASHIAGLIPRLGRLDTLVFAGGIGENASTVRDLICQQLKFLGLELDNEKNKSTPDDLEISTPQSKVKCLVIHTNEELSIAQECAHFT
jgi:acetate kinase